ncbi:hypothetical protein SMSP2_01454 [Limihaloglobus sulfuriphilus]|uniref:Uncharacterized protein n=1 Tax=Limihaloglobus sulfuriphilus TaxID=1851148 RepID=A0A1Q2MEJ3_9BACT|nr:hypothetical protein SMSP2_01454 [Limihaloglobus sulfuriphilus]
MRKSESLPDKIKYLASSSNFQTMFWLLYNISSNVRNVKLERRAYGCNLIIQLFAFNY